MNIPWKKVLVSFITGMLLMVVGGAVTHTFKDWIGPAAGIGGVRQAFAQHEADASIHPNVEAWNEWRKGVDTANKDAKLERAAMQKAQTASTEQILRAIQKSSGSQNPGG